MHEGQKIESLLNEKGLSTADLARACDVEWPAAKKYLAAQELGAKAWQTCMRGLVILGIDPGKIRVGASNASVPEDESIDEVRSIVHELDVAQLRQLTKVLTLSKSAQKTLLTFVDGYLESKKKLTPA